MQTKTIIITGSTRGIGFGLAKEFAIRKHNVIINGTTKEGVEKAINELKKYNKNIIGVTGDIMITDTFNLLITKSVEKFKTIDIWINNAGYPQKNEKFYNLPDEEIQKLLEINLISTLLGTKKAIKLFQTQGFGKIFNMEGFGSDGRTMDKLTLYGTSKRGLSYFNKSISKEIDNPKIHICTINPGMVNTDFLKKATVDLTKEEKERNEKIFKILSSEVSQVSPFIVDKILSSNKNYDRINYLNFFRMFPKIFKLMFVKK